MARRVLTQPVEDLREVERKLQESPKPADGGPDEFEIEVVTNVKIIVPNKKMRVTKRKLVFKGGKLVRVGDTVPSTTDIRKLTE